MLRNIISKIIPNKGNIFFDLFIEGVENVHKAAEVFVNILHCQDEEQLNKLLISSKLLKQNANEINKKVVYTLNNMFITPLDRGDIQELSGLLNKLTKRITKISTKLRIYNIDATCDDCLIRTADTLLRIAKNLEEIIKALKFEDAKKIEILNEIISELEENGIEDFRHAINEMYSGAFDTLTILKLKEIYKSIDSVIEIEVSLADLALQVSLKRI